MKDGDPRYNPHLAIFQDWYLFNDTSDEGYGLLDCTFHQALDWCVNHCDLSLEWHCVSPDEILDN